MPAVARPGPNVLLVTIDTLRADHVGASGYANARTPTLDRLAAEGVVLANNYTNLTGTNPSHASIMTGSYPGTHGVRSHMLDVLKPGVSTIAESFASAGYATAGLYSWVSLEAAYCGLDRGFQTYTDLTVNLPAYLASRQSSVLAATYKRVKELLAFPNTLDRSVALSDQIEDLMDGKADVTTDGALQWLHDYLAQPRRSGRPFFLWVHYFDPHYPYTPPSPFDRLQPDDCTSCADGSMPTIRLIEARKLEQFTPAQVRRLEEYYDGEIAFADQQLGRLLDELRAQGLDENTLTVVLGDHGEGFGEHAAWLHGSSVYNQESHVPVFLRFPGRLPAGTVVTAVTRSVDVMPTILHLFGLPVPSTVDGVSVMPLLRGDATDDRAAIIELNDRSIVSIVTGGWQLVKHSQTGALELYRAADAPGDQVNLAQVEAAVTAELLQRLDAWEAEHP